MGGGNTETKTVCQTVKTGKYKTAPSIQCKACGTINITKYVNSFYSTNPKTLILSSLVSEF